MPPTVTIPGDLSHATLPAARVLARAAMTSQGLTLDLSRCVFITTDGIGLLLELHRETSAKGGSLTLTHLQPMVADVLRRTQIDRLIKVA